MFDKEFTDLKQAQNLEKIAKNANEKKEPVWARIRRINGRVSVVILASRSPIADVLEEIPCGSEADAMRVFNRVKKMLGREF